MALSEPRLIELILARYGSNHQTETPAPPVPDDTAQLHELRKRAKLARYVAESAPTSAVAAQRLAGQFAILQQAGGEWHDWLVLAQVAAGELGSSAKLPQRFAAHADHALLAFRRCLGVIGDGGVRPVTVRAVQKILNGGGDVVGKVWHY